MHTLHGADLFVTAANVIYLLSYLARDILWLRSLAVIAGSLLLPYYYAQPEPLWLPIGWGVVFIAINGYWIVKLAADRRPVQLTGDALRLHDLAFESIQPRQMLELIEVGAWKELQDGDRLLEKDRQLKELSVILSGHAEVFLDDTVVGEIGPGQFAGQVALATGGKTRFTARAAGPMRLLTWDLARLSALGERDQDLQVQFTTIIGRDLAMLLKKALNEA